MINKIQLLGVFLLVVMFVLSVVIAVYAFSHQSLSPNEQTLNAYATFESTCHYRGYDRNECLLIWSGR